MKKLVSAFERSFRIILILWAVFLIDCILNHIFQVEIASYGLRPRSLSGLIGIFTGPFLHGSLFHILSNSFCLMTLLPFYYFAFSNTKVNEVIFKIVVLSGILLWLFGRGDSLHIGASSLVYGLAFYMCPAGWIHKKPVLLSFGVTFMIFQGISLFIGMLPTNPSISWEGHILGALAGIIVAVSEMKRYNKIDANADCT